jgi:hypothetical protein
MAVIRDLLGHHSVTLTEKYYAHLVSGNLKSAVPALRSGDGFIPRLLPKTVENRQRRFAPLRTVRHADVQLRLRQELP